jgi:fibronectin-binding autotransporter adhesin
MRIRETNGTACAGRRSSGRATAQRGRRLCLAVAAPCMAAMGVAVPGARAATYVFGPTSGNFSTPGNYVGGVAPSAAGTDNVTLNGSNATTIVNYTAADTGIPGLGTLVLNPDSTSNSIGVFNQNAGVGTTFNLSTLTLSATNGASKVGLYNLLSGTLNVSTAINFGTAGGSGNSLGQVGAGINVSSGAVLNYNSASPTGLAFTSGATSFMNVNGAVNYNTATSTAVIVLGGLATATGTVNVGSGGAFNVSGPGGLTVGANGGVGNYNVNGGSTTIVAGNLVVGGTTTLTTAANGANGTVTLTNGGALNFSGFQIREGDVGTANGTINVSSGTLTAISTAGSSTGYILGNGVSSTGTLLVGTSGTASLTGNKLALGNANNSTGTFNVSGGTATVTVNTNTANGFLLGNANGATGSLVVTNAGTFNLGGTAASLTAGAANNSTGTITVTNGAAFNGSAAKIALGAASNAVGSLNVTVGSTFSLSGASSLNVGAANNSTGNLVVDSSTLNYNGTTNMNVALNGGVGNVTVSGTGTLNANAANFIYVGNGGPTTGTLNVTGSGTLNAGYYNAGVGYGTIVLGQYNPSGTNNATGVLNLSGAGTVSAYFLNLGGSNAAGLTNGIVNLNGGTLQTYETSAGTSTTLTPSASTLAFNANAGTVTQVAGAQPNYFNGLYVDLLAGGLTFNTADAVGLTPAFMTGPGALTKIGTGTLSVAVNTTYTGGTNVNAGTFAANTAGTGNSSTGTAASAVVVGAGANLVGGTKTATGMIAGTVLVSSGANISAGSGATREIKGVGSECHSVKPRPLYLLLAVDIPPAAWSSGRTASAAA